MSSLIFCLENDSNLIYHSYDYNNWEMTDTGTSFYDISYGVNFDNEKYYIAVSKNGTLKSSDGLVWSNIDNIKNDGILCTSTNNTSSSWLRYDTNNISSISDNGENWTDLGLSLSAIKKNNNVYENKDDESLFAIKTENNNQLFSLSYNGVNWNGLKNISINNTPGTEFKNYEIFNNRIIFYGNQNNIINDDDNIVNIIEINNNIFTGPVNMTLTNLAPIPGIKPVSVINNIVLGKDDNNTELLIGVGDNLIYSYNGTDWSSIFPGGAIDAEFLFFNENLNPKWVFYDLNSKKYFISNNGINWQVENTVSYIPSDNPLKIIKPEIYKNIEIFL
jgi:hypothetical protein